jgi:type IV pilus assembly protein PilC
MPIFQYSGLKPNGEPVSGQIEAADKNEANALLRIKQLEITSLHSEFFSLSSGLFNRVKLQDISAFTRQFATMIGAGLPLIQGINSIEQQTENRTLKEAVRKISDEVQTGMSLTEALSHHPHIFNQLYCAMVKVGEAGGILERVLMRLAEYQEKTVSLRRKVKTAMAYPLIVFLVAIGALMALMTFVVPTFASMLSDLGSQLPLPTRVIIQTSNWMKEWLLAILAGAFILFSGVFVLQQRIPSFKYFIHSLRLHLPLFGDLTRKSAVSRFTRTLGALLSGGVTISEALEITAKTAGNQVLEAGILKALEAIKSGKSLSDPLQETGIFPPLVVQMVSVGEKTGKLPDMLERISIYYDNEVDSAITALTSVIEPVLIVFMGLLVGGVLIAMYLPMFELISKIG